MLWAKVEYFTDNVTPNPNPTLHFIVVTGQQVHIQLPGTREHLKLSTDSGLDSEESYSPQPDYEDWHTEVDSAVFYNHYMDFHEGHVDYGEYRECSDVSLRSDGGFDYGEDPSTEVEEVLYGDPSNGSDVASTDSENDETPARQISPKALPRRRCLGVSKPSRVVQRGATTLEDTQPTRVYSTWNSRAST
ncbi:hypothetical protein P4O66_001481 [Electrophorus voltai]|uniref:Uncharacterized protein n=1 Tax=Electrophorus voltai TaxID=2609070 RepID=A0AAD8Z7B1_9TELE|nr:hypothetical protein P4O66_001481 [Electrophorus voltai]